MANINDVLKAFLEAVTGLTGLSLNDQLQRLGSINYVIAPRTETDPIDPPIGAEWTNTTTGERRAMTAAGIQRVVYEPIP